MKILSINITEFGGLSDFKLEFDGALNIIEGGNESGKSTILLFIIYMLYGLPKTARKNTPGAYDRSRSLSWANSKAEGSMEIEQDGVHYRIERTNVRRTATSEAQITDIDTGARAHMGKEPGEVFLGVSRETFESCLWCGQSRAAAISGEKLTETLSNLSLTADESVNGESVLSEIKNARKQYKHERGDGGRIYEVSKKISEKLLEANRIKAKLEQSMADSERYSELEKAKREADDALRKAEAEKTAVRTLTLLSRFGALRRFKETIELDRKELERLEKEGVGKFAPDANEYAELKALERTYFRKRQDCETCRNTFQTDSDVDTEAVGVAERIASRENRDVFFKRIADKLSRSRKSGIVGITCLAVSCISAIIFGVISTALSDSILPMVLSLCCSAAVAVTGGIILALAKKDINAVKSELDAIGCNTENYKKRISYCFEQLEKAKSESENAEKYKRRISVAEEALATTEKDIDESLLKFGIESENRPQSLSRLIAEVGEYLEKKNEIAQRLSVNRRIAENDERQLEEYNEEELTASLPENLRDGLALDESAAEQRRKEAEDTFRRIESELRELEIKIKSSRVSLDIQADVEGEIAALEELRNQYTERYEVLNRAYAAVEEAYGNMRRSFAPRIRDRAGKLLDGISEGKYSRIFLSEDFGVGVEVSGKERSAGCLSSGTSDAVYIALRLSLIENIFDKTVPFFMDETLSQLDDTRAKGVLGLISEYVAGGNQCVLLTCHDREAKLCDDMGICYRKTDISR